MMKNREIEKITCIALDMAESRGWINDETDIASLSVKLKRTANKTSYVVTLSRIHEVGDFKMEFDLEQ